MSEPATDGPPELSAGWTLADKYRAWLIRDGSTQGYNSIAADIDKVIAAERAHAAESERARAESAAECNGEQLEQNDKLHEEIRELRERAEAAEQSLESALEAKGKCGHSIGCLRYDEEGDEHCDFCRAEHEAEQAWEAHAEAMTEKEHAETSRDELRAALRALVAELDTALMTDDDLPVAEACEAARRLLEKQP